MYYFKKVFLVCFWGSIFWSCNEPLKNTKKLVAIDSLLDAQVLMLTKQKTILKKSASIDGKDSSSALKIMDSATWAQELEVFRQLDMVNRPLYIAKYNVEDNQQDVNSNLQILSISTTETLPIPELKVYYQDNLSKVRRIEGSYFESNSIFSGTRNLSLQFQDYQGRLSLTKYTIAGGQKMMLGDSVMYQIEGVIEYQ